MEGRDEKNLRRMKKERWRQKGRQITKNKRKYERRERGRE